MLKIVTTENRIVDQYAKQSHLENYVPDEILEYNYNVLREHKADQELKNTISNLTPIRHKLL